MRRDDEHAGARPNAVADQSHPGFYVRAGRVVARVPDQDVERALGKEELLGGAVILLAAEIPEVQGHRLAGKRGMGALHGLHLKPARRARRGETVADQPLLERRLPDRALANEHNLGLEKLAHRSYRSSRR